MTYPDKMLTPLTTYMKKCELDSLTVDAVRWEDLILTDKEQAELKILEQEHKESTLLAKKDVFKNINPEIREHMINELSSLEAINTIENAKADTVERLAQLKYKSSTRLSYSSAGTGLDITSSSNAQTLLKYFSLKEMIELHKEALIEEMICPHQ